MRQGKSVLLQGLLGELPLLSGSMTATPSNYTVAYCAQESFLQTTETVRDNITYMTAYDSTHYDHVVRSCGLEIDFASFALGDQRCVGYLECMRFH